jgi:hypothetical protein
MINPALVTEEYKQIAAQIAEIEKQILQILLTSVVSVVSLLAAVVVFLFGAEGLAKASPVAASIMSASLLIPTVIILSVFYIIYGLRLEAFFLGKYIQVFFDEADVGTGFESRLESMRQIRKVEHLDYIRVIIWAMIIVCGLAYSYAVASSQASKYLLLLSFVPLAVMVRMSKIYSTRVREAAAKYLADWRSLRKTVR